MSKSEIERFHQEVQRDPRLQDRLRQANNESKLVSVALELGQEKGYKFTKQELEAYLHEAGKSLAKRELTEKELENVTGGAGARPYLDDCSCRALQKD
jgi:predicted ribosomally synthesized peptide with nif11-like leader